MPDYSFYDAGCVAPKGLARVMVLFRRLLRRVLRPIFQRQAVLFAELDAKIDQVAGGLGGLAQRQERLEAFECDGAALARRLAALEDRLDTLLTREAATPEAGSSSLLPFSKSA